MIPFRKSIGFRLFAISFILLALPLLVDSFILIGKRYQESIQSAKGYLVEVARLRELPLSHIRPLNESVLLLIVSALNLEAGFPQKETEELNQELKKIAAVGQFSGIFLIKFSEQGKYLVIGSSDETVVGKNYANFFKLNRSLMAEPSDASSYASFITYDSKTHKPYFIATYDIYGLENKPVGLLAVSYDITKRMDELLKPDKRRYQVNFALLLSSGIVFAASDPELAFNYLIPLQPEYLELFKKVNPFASHLIPNQPLKVSDTLGFPFFEFKWKGEEQIAYIQKMQNLNFSLLSYASKKDVFRLPLKNYLNIYGVYAAILLIGGTLAWLIIKRMASPIQRLSKVMVDIQKGNLSSRYKKDHLGFEINTLGSIFNHMIDNLLTQKHLAEEERVGKETLAKELRLGQQVQRTLLPQKMPEYPGVELAATYIPAIEVGGDFYDVFVKKSQDDNQLVLAIADASGKGVRACFYSLSLRNMIRVYAKESSNIGEAMAQANNLFCKDTGDSGMFVTAIGGIYDRKKGRFEYFSCGHNPLIVLRKDGRVEILNHQSMAMGIMPVHEKVEAHHVELQEGDSLILYTDGITEAHNAFLELYGEERLLNLLKRMKGKSASELAKSIVHDVDLFVEKAPQHDDITLLVMKVVDI